MIILQFLGDNWVSIVAIVGWIVAATPTQADDAVWDRIKNVAGVFIPMLRPK